MKTMDGILKEELARLKVTEKGYAREIRKLPKGTIHEKRIKGHLYPYLVYSKGSKVIYRYVGKLADAELAKLKDDIALRKRYQKLRYETCQNIRRIEKILHGKR